MRTQSVWKGTTASGDFPALSGDLDVDVAVIGGGITGLSTAYLLAREGRNVAVLEARRIGEGTTGHSTGNLYTLVDERLYEVRSKFDTETMKLVAESRARALEFVEQRILEYRIDCAFRHCPWVLYAESDETAGIVAREADAAEKAGLPVTRRSSIELPFGIRSAIQVDGQAQFNPLAFAKGLACGIESDCCRIFENTVVTDIEEGEPCVVQTAQGTVRAKEVVMATHTPKGISFLQTLLGPYREYGIAVRLKDGAYPPGGIYWSTEQPHHHSIRSYTAGGETYLLVIGEPHKVGQEEDNVQRIQKLEEFARSRFDVSTVEYRWGGQNYRPADGLPYIGRSAGSDHLYLATGFATDGLLYGVVGAKLMTDLIAGQRNPWSDAYDRGRFTPVASAGRFLKENINEAGQYLKNLPGVADEERLTDIPRGEGRTVELDGHKCAVYRSGDDTYHVVSAVCTHLKCIVSWNRAERSWDCPCHGSRFDIDGSVIEGPAYQPLPQVPTGKGKL